MSFPLSRPWSPPATPPVPLAPPESRRRFEVLLVKLTVAVAPVLVVNWLLIPSRDPQLALTSQLIIPLYAILALGAARLRPALLTRTWFEFLLFALQVILTLIQMWAYEQPGSPLWLAFLPALLVGAARWQLPGACVSLGWFYLDRVLTLPHIPGFGGRDLARELTLELTVMTLMGVVFGFLFRELERHRQRLRESAASLAAVLENVGEAILTVDGADTIDAANLAAGELFACEPSALRGWPIDELLPTYGITVSDLVRHGRRFQSRETRGLRRNGTIFTAEVVTSLIVGDGGPVRILVLRDITELRAQTAALSYQALHDALTGLPNRLQFTEALLDRVALARRNGSPLSLMIMDMDNFKEVNDTRGHHVGDLLLQAAGQRLKKQLRDGDLVARLGGDEFALLPAPSATPGAATIIAEKILRAFAEPFSVDDGVVETGISIGIARFPEDGDDVEALMRHADRAMYTAKRNGGGWATATAAAATLAPERAPEENLISAADIRRAVEDGELELRCEPVMNLHDKSVQGVDAHVRWRHPGLGLLEAEEFMPLAERSGAIRPLVRCVMRLAAEQMAKWREEAGSEVSVSVRVSERNLRDGQLASAIADLLVERDLPTRSLTMLTDHSTAQAPGAAEFFTVASRHGLRLAIDDYGSGSLSLLRLRSMPINEIRVAAELTARVTRSPTDAAIVRGIIEMAHTLGITAVAKGVGDEATLTLLRELGCDAVTFQEWSHPLPAAALGTAIDEAALQTVLTGSRQVAVDPLWLDQAGSG